MNPLLARALADLVMLAHFAFVLFVVLGALLVLWRGWVAWLHVPCAAYGVAIELFGWICPLTPLERRLRLAAGQGGYEGGFVDHYIGGALYPADWSDIHLLLAAAVVLVNAALYGLVLRRRRRGRDGAPEGARDEEDARVPAGRG